MTQRDDVLVDNQIMGLDPEFSLRVEWRPGGRIDKGELILDPRARRGCSGPRSEARSELSRVSSTG